MYGVFFQYFNFSYYFLQKLTFNFQHSILTIPFAMSWQCLRNTKTFIAITMPKKWTVLKNLHMDMLILHC